MCSQIRNSFTRKRRENLLFPSYFEPYWEPHTFLSSSHGMRSSSITGLACPWLSHYAILKNPALPGRVRSGQGSALLGILCTTSWAETLTPYRAHGITCFLKLPRAVWRGGGTQAKQDCQLAWEQDRAPSHSSTSQGPAPALCNTQLQSRDCGGTFPWVLFLY